MVLHYKLSRTYIFTGCFISSSRIYICIQVVSLEVVSYIYTKGVSFEIVEYIILQGVSLAVVEYLYVYRLF